MGSQASAVFLLPPAAQGRTAAEKGQLHVLPGQHPSPTRVLQHLRAHGPANGRPYGRYGRAEAVRTLTHAHSVCGLAANVLGLVHLMPLFLLGTYTPTIPHQLRQHRSGRFPHRLADAADELGKKGSNVTFQRVRDQLMAVAVGANHVWGACRWLRLRSGA